MKKKVLDVTKEKCPITFLKAKEFLKVTVNYERIILIKGKDDSKKLINALNKNFEIETEKNGKSIYKITVKRSKSSSP